MAEEAAISWQKVLDHWPETPVSRFADATLADGTPDCDIDLNDLVCVAEFEPAPSAQPFVYNSVYNSGYMKARHETRTILNTPG